VTTLKLHSIGHDTTVYHEGKDTKSLMIGVAVGRFLYGKKHGEGILVEGRWGKEMCRPLTAILRFLERISFFFSLFLSFTRILFQFGWVSFLFRLRFLFSHSLTNDTVASRCPQPEEGKLSRRGTSKTEWRSCGKTKPKQHSSAHRLKG